MRRGSGVHDARNRDAQARRGRRNLDSVHELDAGPRVLAQQQVSVQVDVVAQRSDAASGGDAETRLEHAPEHHAEPERTRGMRHPDRLPDSARLGELDVDAVRDPRAALHVREDVAVLVDVDRDRRALPQRAPALVACAAAAARSTRRRARRAAGSESTRLVERPRLVDVDLERERGDPADRAHALDVEAVSASELELQPPVARRRLLRPPRHVVRVAEPHRPRGRRAFPREPEQAMRGKCRAASPEGRGAPRRSPPSPPARPGRAARRAPISSSANGSSPTSSACSCDEPGRGLRGLLVALDRRGLAVPGRSPCGSEPHGRRRRGRSRRER